MLTSMMKSNIQNVMIMTSKPSRGIESRPGVCGGDPCIAGTRITVWGLVQYRNLGATEDEMLVSFPGLRIEDLTSAWVYYDTHQAEIDQQIQDNEHDEDE